MIDKICDFLTKRIRKEMPDIDDERAEAIFFGLQNIIGEIPKLFILVLLAFILGIGELTLLAYILILPYKSASGGFHLKTHIGCILGTSLFFCGTVLISKYIVLGQVYRYLITLAVWIFGMIMTKLYAPADTENIPILDSKTRKRKKITSYLTLTISLGISVFIPNQIIANILLVGMFFQAISITKIAYKLTKNKYGYEVYSNQTSIV